MASSLSPKDEIWFPRVYHHISNAVYLHRLTVVPFDLLEETSPLTTGFVGFVVPTDCMDKLPKKANRVFAGYRFQVIFSIKNFFTDGVMLITTVGRYILVYWQVYLHCAVQKFRTEFF